MAYYFGQEVNDLEEVTDRIRAVYETFKSISSQDVIGGFSYSNGHMFTGLDNGSTVNTLLENPSDSGVYVMVYTRFITDGKFYCHKSLNVSVTDTGTEEAVQERRSDKPNDANSNAYHSSTVDETNAREFTPKVVGSSNIQGSAVEIPEAMLAPGDNIYLEATSSGGNDVTMDIDIVEVPKQLVDELETRN